MTTEQESRYLETIQDKLEEHSNNNRARLSRFTLSALAGIPWIGGLLSALSAFHSEKTQAEVNMLQKEWLKKHEQKLAVLGGDLKEIFSRLEKIGTVAEERLEEPDYLQIVEQGFRAWDRASTNNKRTLLKRLIANAGSTRLCSDDVIRLFIEWIDKYHEIHFSVISAVYSNPGITRAGIWDEISGKEVRDDSSEADLFKLMIRDLSTGSVLRQVREADNQGRFLKKKTKQRKGPFLTSPFDNTKLYVLTELGKQFVHYAMDEVVPRVGRSTNTNS